MDYSGFKCDNGYYYVIYKVTNLINDRHYIGRHQTKDIADGYMGSGIAINAAIKKYGKDNFKKEYLYFCSSKEELILKEIELVNESIVKDPCYYNMSLGGAGNFDSATQKVKDLHEDKNSEWYKNRIKRCSEDSIKSWKTPGRKEK